MIVELVAYTTIIPEALERMGYVPHPAGTVKPGDELAEVGGRECYQSWGRPNPGTATNKGYLGNIINHSHFSVLEHTSLTFSIRKVSRSLTHELIRHRHLSPSQVSQRYVDESHGEFVLPPDADSDIALVMTDAHHDALALYDKIFQTLTEAGVSRKRARQAARYVLPNGHETRLMMTGNVRAWREFVTKRRARDPLTKVPLADLEMFELADRILILLHEHVPNSVQDLWAEAAN